MPRFLQDALAAAGATSRKGEEKSVGKVLRVYADGYKTIREPATREYHDVEDRFRAARLVRYTSIVELRFEVLRDTFSLEVVKRHRISDQLYLDSLTFRSPQVEFIRRAIEHNIARIQRAHSRQSTDHVAHSPFHAAPNVRTHVPTPRSRNQMGVGETEMNGWAVSPVAFGLFAPAVRPSQLPRMKFTATNVRYANCVHCLTR